MAIRKTNKTKLYKYSVGDLKHRISFFNRSLMPTDDAYEESLDEIIIKWAAIESVNPKHLFSDVNLDGKKISNKIIIRYDSDINSNKLIKYDGSIYKIVYLDDPELRKEWMVLYVHLEGKDTTEANK